MEQYFTIKNVAIASAAVASITILCTILCFDTFNFLNFSAYIHYPVSVMLLANAAFFFVCTKDTDDDILKNCSYVSIVSAIILAIYLIYDAPYIGYNTVSKWVTFILYVAAIGISVFHFYLFRKSGYSMGLICVPAMIGLLLVGLSLTIWKLYYVMFWEHVIILPCLLLTFSYYKLYKKL